MSNSAWHQGNLTVHHDGNAWLTWGAGFKKFFLDANDALSWAQVNDITHLALTDGGQ